MSQISLKSISGITSITTPTGVDNQFTLHTNNGADNISLSDFESFEDTMTAPSGLSFSINSAGELEMTI